MSSSSTMNAHVLDVVDEPTRARILDFMVNYLSTSAHGPLAHELAATFEASSWAQHGLNLRAYCARVARQLPLARTHVLIADPATFPFIHLQNQLDAAMTGDEQLQLPRINLCANMQPLNPLHEADILAMRADLIQLMREIDHALLSLLARSASAEDFRAAFLHHRTAFHLVVINKSVIQQMLAVHVGFSGLESAQLEQVGRRVADVYTHMERDAVHCFGPVDAANALPEFRVPAWLRAVFDAARAAVSGTGSPLLSEARYLPLPAPCAVSTTSSMSPSAPLPHPGSPSPASSPLAAPPIATAPPPAYNPSASRGTHRFVPKALFPARHRARSATPDSLISSSRPPSMSPAPAISLAPSPEPAHHHDTQAALGLDSLAASAELTNATHHQSNSVGGRMDVGPLAHTSDHAQWTDAIQTLRNRTTTALMVIEAREMGVVGEDEQLPAAVLARIEHLRAIADPFLSSRSISDRLRSNMEEMIRAMACDGIMTDSEVKTAIAAMWVKEP